MTQPLSESLTIAPKKSSSTGDTLLRNFRATLDARWSEFDRATIQEAQERAGLIGFFLAKPARDADGEFQKAKQLFDEAKALLATVNTDDELKKSTTILAQAEQALNGLTTYLASVKPEEKAKSHNIILAKTKADLADFRAQITGNPDDKIIAETASKEEKSIARPVIAAAAGSGLSVFSSAEASTVVKEVGGEVSREIEATKKGWFASIKKEFGFDKDSLLTDFQKKAKGESVGIWGSIKLMFASFLLRHEKISSWLGKIGLNLTEGWTTEELKLAGMSVPDVSPKLEKPREAPKDRYDISRYVFEKLLVENKENLPITNILDAVKMKGSTIGELQQVYKSKSYNDFLSKISLVGNDPRLQKGLKAILDALFDGNKGKYTLEAYNSAKNISKKTTFPSNETFGEYIISAGTIMKKMGGIARASIEHKMPEAPFRWDENKKDVVFSGAKEEEEDVFHLFQGDKKILSYMLGINSDEKIRLKDINNVRQSTALESRYPNKEDRAKAEEKLHNIMNFSKNFLENVVKNEDIHLGMGSELQKIMNERDFSMKFYAFVYMTLNGKDIGNFAELSTIEQSQIYGMIMMVFHTDKNSYDKGKLTSDYLTALNKSSQPIPQGVKIFFADAGKYAGEKGMNALTEGAKYLGGLAVSNPTIAAIFAALNIPWIPARNAPLDYVF